MKTYLTLRIILLITVYLLQVGCHAQSDSSTHPSGLDAHSHQVAAAIDTLMNADQITFDHEEAGHLVPVGDYLFSSSSEQIGKYIKIEEPSEEENEEPEEKTRQNNPTESPEQPEIQPSNPSSSLLVGQADAADIPLMNETFREIFMTVRSDDYDSQLKETARNAILARMKDFKLEAFTQSFTANRRGGSGSSKGINIVGVLPGRHRDIPGKDDILLIGAHYDTVSSSPGIDDNASGMILMLELARILSTQPQLNHTIMFVGFDLEELGLLGSMAFVREHLIPNEMIDRKANFLGAYVIDMALNYDSRSGSQTLPRDIMIACPGVTSKIAQDGNRGDFMAVWMRKGVDNSVYRQLVENWKGSTKYKLRVFDPVLPGSEPSASDLYRYGTFTRSDHASFWYHKHPNFKKTLNAILLTDMGVWRGQTGPKCYHNWCDDGSQLTERNLRFLKNTIDSLVPVLLNPPNLDDSDKENTDGANPVPNPDSNIPTFGHRTKPTKPGRSEGRGHRTRGRTPSRPPTSIVPSDSNNPPTSRWPAQFPSLGSFPGSSFFPSFSSGGYPSIPSLGSIPSSFAF